ncbi:hypothetical protein [Microbacterium sp. NPDC056234]|uniref:hypothetical protein n=1 Tax=Microbacterium sp. NPDC056234 TaxID=3345757 RepID=UPI0035DED7BA
MPRKSVSGAADSPIDLTAVTQRTLAAVETHRREDGFARFTAGESRDLYGTADAIGILATFDRLDQDVLSRDTLSWSLRSLQRTDGRFVDDSHGVLHATATGIGGLFLLGARPEPPAFLTDMFEVDRVAPFLDGLDWSNPWLASHDAAGLLAIATMTGVRHPGWWSEYFRWLDLHVDPTTGLWPSSNIGRLEDWPGLFGNLGCSFHLHFLLRHHGRRIPAAHAVVDTCLDIASGTEIVFGANAWGYPQLDWAYSLARATAQSGHRAAEATSMLCRLAEALSASGDVDETDLHTVGAIAALVAELSAALGEIIVTGEASSPTTDLRPFI